MEKFLALVDRTGMVCLALLGENEKNAFKIQKSIFSHFFVHSLVSYFVWKCGIIGIRVIFLSSLIDRAASAIFPTPWSSPALCWIDVTEGM